MMWGYGYGRALTARLGEEYQTQGLTSYLLIETPKVYKKKDVRNLILSKIQIEHLTSDIPYSSFPDSIKISRIFIPASVITVPGPKMATAPASYKY